MSKLSDGTVQPASVCKRSSGLVVLVMLVAMPCLATAQSKEGKWRMRIETLELEAAGPERCTSLITFWKPVSEALSIAGSPIEIRRDGKGCVALENGSRVAGCKTLPGQMELSRTIQGRPSKYSIRLRIGEGGAIEAATSMAMAISLRNDTVLVLDVDLDGIFLERNDDGCMQGHSRTMGPFTAEIWWLEGGFKVQGPSAEEVTLICDVKMDEDRALCVINYYRQLAGLGSVRRDAELSEGCQLHADYLASHHGTKFNWHTENPEEEGYTEQGAEAAARSIFGVDSDYAVSIIENLDLVYHRRFLLDPRLPTVGFGRHIRSDTSLGDAPRRLSVIDVKSGAVTDVSDGDLVLWPVAGQIDVPCDFSGYEVPVPLPAGVSRHGHGYPITVIFPRHAKVTGTKLEVFLEKGKKSKPVDGYVFGPDRLVPDDGSTYSYAYQENSGICHFISRAPLEQNSRYRVKFEGTVNGAAQAIEWWFETGTNGASPVR